MLLARIPNSLSLSLSPSLSLSLNPFLFPSLLQSAFSVRTELMNVSLGRLANTVLSMCGSPQDNLAYEFVPTSPAVPSMSCLSYLDGLWDGRLVDVQQLFCWLLLQRFVQYNMQYACMISIKFFLHVLC